MVWEDILLGLVHIICTEECFFRVDARFRIGSSDFIHIANHNSQLACCCTFFFCVDSDGKYDHSGSKRHKEQTDTSDGPSGGVFVM